MLEVDLVISENERLGRMLETVGVWSMVLYLHWSAPLAASSCGTPGSAWPCYTSRLELIFHSHSPHRDISYMEEKSETTKKYIPDSMNSYAYYLLPQISIFLRPNGNFLLHPPPPPPSLEKPFPQKSHSSLFLPSTRPVP